MAARWERQFQSVLPWIIERDHTYHLTPQTWPIITIITSVLKLGRALSDRPTKSNYDHCDVLIEQQHFLMNCFHLTLVWHPSPHGSVRPPHIKCLFILVEHELCLSVSHQPSANRAHCANSGLLVVLVSCLAPADALQVLSSVWRSGPAQRESRVTFAILFYTQNSSHEFWHCLDSPGAAQWGGKLLFSFGSNMEMLSAAPTDRENEDKIRAGAGQDKQGWELRNVRHAILANSNKLNDIHTFDTLLELIFCVKHNFNQVSQKKVLWNVFDYYQVRRGEERRGWSPSSNKMILSADTDGSCQLSHHYSVACLESVCMTSNY